MNYAKPCHDCRTWASDALTKSRPLGAVTEVARWTRILVPVTCPRRAIVAHRARIVGVVSSV